MSLTTLYPGPLFPPRALELKSADRSSTTVYILWCYEAQNQQCAGNIAEIWLHIDMTWQLSCCRTVSSSSSEYLSVWVAAYCSQVWTHSYICGYTVHNSSPEPVREMECAHCCAHYTSVLVQQTVFSWTSTHTTTRHLPTPLHWRLNTCSEQLLKGVWLNAVPVRLCLTRLPPV